jgi:ankyrin repeat protein
MRTLTVPLALRPSPAPRRGGVGVVKMLLQAGAQIDARDRQGCTALMWALSQGEADSVKALLAAGANVNLKNVYGDSALNLAARGAHSGVVHLLKKAGAR